MIVVGLLGFVFWVMMVFEIVLKIVMFIVFFVDWVKVFIFVMVLCFF